MLHYVCCVLHRKGITLRVVVVRVLLGEQHIVGVRGYTHCVKFFMLYPRLRHDRQLLQLVLAYIRGGVLPGTL